MTRADVVVVGAGSAGCVLAARLAENSRRRVLLLEAGPDAEFTGSEAEAIRGPSFLRAMGLDGRTWGDLNASMTTGAVPRPYRRGRGVGGSSAINAMVALPGEPDDYDRWERDHGCTGWGWADVAPWFARLPVPLFPAAGGELGALATAVLDAEPRSEAAVLTRTADGLRASNDEVYLRPARARGNLVVRADALVDRVLLDGRRAVGVRLADGEELEAATVVVAAGAIHSPAILLRSAVDREGVGDGLQDHPSFPLVVQRRDDRPLERARVAVGALLRDSFRTRHDVQLLALDEADLAVPGLSVLLAAVMDVHSRGTVRLASADPWVQPLVDMAMLSDHRDDDVLAASITRGAELLAHPAMSAVGDVLAFDDSESGRRAAVGDYVHAAGSCAMGPSDRAGTVVGTTGRVHGYDGLYVGDASVIPRVPRANTHLPVTMLAERIAARLSAELAPC